MPRANKSGVRGLHVSGPRNARRYKIDLRYRGRRYVERLPEGTSAAAAKRRAQEVLSAAVAGTLPTDRRKGETTLADAFEEYLEWCEAQGLRTVRDRRSLSRVWLRTMGDVPMSRVDRDFVKRFQAERRKPGSAMRLGKDEDGEPTVRRVDGKRASPATINRAVAMLKHMCNVAVEEGWPWMTEERAATIGRVKMESEPAGRQRAISSSEITKIRKVLRDKPHVRRIMEVALHTGCRMGQILSLRREQVDLKARLLRLPALGNKNKRPHTIPIEGELRRILKEALDAAPGEVVFPNSRGVAYTTSGFSSYWRRLLQVEGIENLTFHDLRRHVGTVLINAGERMEVVSKLLGHSTLAVTQRSYAHLSVDSTRAAVARLGGST